MNDIIGEIHSSITGQKEKIELRYEPNTAGVNFEEVLLKNREKDFKFRNSSSGPHKTALHCHIFQKLISLV